MLTITASRRTVPATVTAQVIRRASRQQSATTANRPSFLIVLLRALAGVAA
jgi:hypothetical protein